MPLLREGGIDQRHTGQQRRAADPVIDRAGVIMPVGDLFAAVVLINGGPDVGRRAADAGVAETIVLLEQGQYTTSASCLLP
jgi:hypothetical protein